MLSFYIFFCFIIISLSEAFNPLHQIRTKNTKKNIIYDNSIRKIIKQEKSFQLYDATIEVFQNVEGISEAFVGGTVGVMSVMFMLEFKKKEDVNLESCPYCMGNGEILCACCCGSGLIDNKNCSVCSGTGLVVCINCKGDGRITPILLQSRAIRDPEAFVDGISIDSP